jgi:hypothetical protein
MASVSPSTHFYSTSRAKRTLAGTPKLPVTAPRLKLNYTRPNARGVVDEAMEDDGLPDTKDLISTPSNAKVQRKNPPVKEASAAAEVIRTYELDINQDFRLDHITFSTQLLTHDLHDPNRLSYAEIVKAQNEIMQSRERGNSKVHIGRYPGGTVLRRRSSQMFLYALNQLGKQLRSQLYVRLVNTLQRSR